MVAEVTALGETEVCSGEAELLLFKYCNTVLGISYSSKGLFVGAALFTIAAFSTVRGTQAVPLRCRAFLAFHHLICVVSLAGIQTNLRAGGLNARTSS